MAEYVDLNWVVPTAESRRTCEDPGFDAAAFERDRAALINEGMATSRSAPRPIGPR